MKYAINRRKGLLCKPANQKSIYKISFSLEKQYFNINVK